MSDVFEIFIITPKEYDAIAEKVREVLSSQPGFLSKVSEAKHFIDQGISEQSNRWFISIGDADENIFSNWIIRNKIKGGREDTGDDSLFILAEKPYAVIFGASDYAFADSAKDTWKELSSLFGKAKEKILSKEPKSAKTVKDKVAVGATIAIALLAPIHAGIGATGVFIYSRSRKLREIKHQKTQLAVAAFFSDVFPSWIPTDSEE